MTMRLYVVEKSKILNEADTALFIQKASEIADIRWRCIRQFHIDPQQLEETVRTAIAQQNQVSPDSLVPYNISVESQVDNNGTHLLLNLKEKGIYDKKVVEGAQPVLLHHYLDGLSTNDILIHARLYAEGIHGDPRGTPNTEFSPLVMLTTNSLGESNPFDQKYKVSICNPHSGIEIDGAEGIRVTQKRTESAEKLKSILELLTVVFL